MLPVGPVPLYPLWTLTVAMANSLLPLLRVTPTIFLYLSLNGSLTSSKSTDLAGTGADATEFSWTTFSSARHALPAAMTRSVPYDVNTSSAPPAGRCKVSTTLAFLAQP